jgi:ribosomal protein L11 methyltransferase
MMLAPRVSVRRVGEAPQPDVLDLAQIDSAAFGDGSHPTTRLCAGAVYHLARGAVLDVGTGSGILARIARARGASFVVATDIDGQAREAAEQNIVLDAHAMSIVVSAALPDHWGSRFDLVVANILQNPLIALAPAIKRAIAPNGTVLLSGFSPAEAPSLRVAYGDLRVQSEAQLCGWSMLVLAR